MLNIRGKFAKSKLNFEIFQQFPPLVKPQLCQQFLSQLVHSAFGDTNLVSLYL